MSVLDNVIRQVIIDREINTTSYTDRFNLGLFEESCSASITWVLGSSFSATLTLEVSMRDDNSDWVTFTDSEQNVSGETGTHVYDIGPTGVPWGRIKIEVSAGTAYINGQYLGKRRH